MKVHLHIVYIKIFPVKFIYRKFTYTCLMIRFIYQLFARFFMLSLPTFYQISFPSHLPDFDTVCLQFLYVRFTRFFGSSFTFVYYGKFGKCTTLNKLFFETFPQFVPRGEVFCYHDYFLLIFATKIGLKISSFLT